jgi:DNA-binding MurR/RpiR family transcriptional regulator
VNRTAPDEPGFRDRVEERRDILSPAERRVADYMLANPERAATWSASELAQALGISDATVIRTAQSLGYRGLKELKRGALSQIERRRDPSLVLTDWIGHLGDRPDALGQVVVETAALLERMTATVDRDAWTLGISYLVQARHVHAFGVGTAGMVAELLAVDLWRIGVPTTAITAAGVRLADGLLGVSSSDTIIILALRRRFREVDAIIRHARRKGARTILVTEMLEDELRSMVDVVLALPTSTIGTGSGLAPAITLAHAIRLAVAAERSERAVSTMQEMIRLREEIVGEPVEIASTSGDEADLP